VSFCILIRKKACTTFYIRAATFLENLENLEQAVCFEKVMENPGKFIENHGWSWKSHGKCFSMQNNFASKG
jgi:hypothetical protein